MLLQSHLTKSLELTNLPLIWVKLPISDMVLSLLCTIVLLKHVQLGYPTRSSRREKVKSHLFPNNGALKLCLCWVYLHGDTLQSVSLEGIPFGLDER